MTKDEAIRIIKTEMECVSRPDCDRLACAYCDLAMRAEDVLTAYQMALTALQTDGDCISRRGTLQAMDTWDKFGCAPDGKLVRYDEDKHYIPYVHYEDMVHAVKHMPSVHPEERTEERTETHACDCISRQAAIDALDNIKIPRNASWYPYYQQALTVMSRLPSVQPEPCEDAVRREDVQSIAEKSDWFESSDSFNDFMWALYALPSVQPEPCEDTISRTDAIRVASGYCHPANVAEELAKLPSVQPDNSCDGCEYENADDGVLVPCGYCKRSYSDNYERRTDEQTD